jgi:lipopolysaccharide biosynthesis glycosyltransferase
MSTDTNDIFYVGSRAGIDDVDILHKSEISKSFEIPSDSNSLMVGTVTFSGTVTVSGTLVII